MKLTNKTRISELVSRYPFLLDFLAEYAPEFRKLRNPVLRNTVGRIATLDMAASMGHLPVERLVADLRAAILEKTGEDPGAPDAPAAPADVEHERRVATLKGILRDLHAGQPMAELKQRFAALSAEVGPAEIPALEQELVGEGLPPEEIHRLCDLHVDVFRAALDKQEELHVPAGHPVHTFLAENRALEKVALALAESVARLGAPSPAAPADLRAQLAATLDLLAQVEKHYVRKENQLFPYLEKYGLSAPPQVMWAVHDQVRALLKAVRGALEGGETKVLPERSTTLVRTVTDMIYKEENILFPMALELLDEAEWAAIRRGEADVGWALIEPPVDWPPPGAAAAAPAAREGKAMSRLPLDTGLLGLDQINLLLSHLPVDITFVDENDEVRYFSRGEERIFPRSPGIIGRKVQNCHPPKSLDAVQRILDGFRDGTRSTAEFWITLQGRFVHIRYFAMRDPQGRYRGTLEVSQDVTGIRALQGERRLLDEEEGGTR
ncbi:MAG: DUF438 domain-containing protein [Deltaproteobacteria bacterium]|nr:DUF438 domain-containing protein [Deltaproteobacteria bacterium]